MNSTAGNADTTESLGDSKKEALYRGLLVKHRTDYAQLIPEYLRPGFHLTARDYKYEVWTFHIKEIVSSFFPPLFHSAL